MTHMSLTTYYTFKVIVMDLISRGQVVVVFLVFVFF